MSKRIGSGILTAVVALGALSPGFARGAEVLLPQNRAAFFTEESVELGVVGLASGSKATVQLTPTRAGLQAFGFDVVGDGSTMVVAFPKGSLAPSDYVVSIDGKEGLRFTVSSGVDVSTMLLSQSSYSTPESGAQFQVGNAFNFGLLGPDGQPLIDVRGKHSPGIMAFEKSSAANLPQMVYMYWTGYATHKPFGTHKSWASADMITATRMLSLHTSQRLKPYRHDIISIGPIDEPTLAWGRTPVGGAASGIPSWDEEPWYRDHQWDYTDNPGVRSDEDWMRYMLARTSILGEAYKQASIDIKTVWPKAVFAGDLYAPHAIMDGADPFNQRVNDTPTTHVFLDWGIGRAGAISAIDLERCDNPNRKVAHAMNGQLMGETVSMPAHAQVYRLMLNSMLAAGITSNWWLNTGPLKPEDLRQINEPGERIGPVFQQLDIRHQDVAVLWSFTELSMREKEITAREATRKSGEQIKLMIPSLPETAGIKDGQIAVNAYNVGQNYKDQLLAAHQALLRAGYPPHFIHERVLTEANLKPFRTLVIVGQTTELRDDVMELLRQFVADGGRIIVDKTTTVSFPKAIVTDADFRDLGYRWSTLFLRAQEKENGFKNDREASYYRTNLFMDEPALKAVESLKASLADTKSKPVIETKSTDLIAQRHTAGDSSVIMVLNAAEKLPDIAEDKKYPIWNYSTLKTTYTLTNLPTKCVVYCLEGADWKTAYKVVNPTQPITASFEPGEMKLYFVVPTEPQLLSVTGGVENNQLTVTASLRLGGSRWFASDRTVGPWPLEISIKTPDGKTLYTVHRAADRAGAYEEMFPLGSNAQPGDYQIEVACPLTGLKGASTISVHEAPDPALPVTEQVRVFEKKPLRDFLKANPTIVVAYGQERYKPIAEKLALDLVAKGLKATAKPEAEVIDKAVYPRIWNPYVPVYSPSGEEKSVEASSINQTITLSIEHDGQTVARTADGKDVTSNWRAPGTLITIAGSHGYVDYSADQEACYEPGVKLFIDAAGKINIIKGTGLLSKSSKEFKARWAAPWTALTTNPGAFQLPPTLPEAYTTQTHLVVLGDSRSSKLGAILQASELVSRVADAKYPGPGKALISLIWSPFALDKNVIFIAGPDEDALKAGSDALVKLAGDDARLW